MSKDTGKHYRFEYKDIKLDPARILAVYGGEKYPLQGAMLKKVLLAGERGHKSTVQDLEDVITAAERAIEMIEEDFGAEDET